MKVFTLLRGNLCSVKGHLALYSRLALVRQRTTSDFRLIISTACLLDVGQPILGSGPDTLTPVSESFWIGTIDLDTPVGEGSGLTEVKEEVPLLFGYCLYNR